MYQSKVKVTGSLLKGWVDSDGGHLSGVHHHNTHYPLTGTTVITTRVVSSVYMTNHALHEMFTRTRQAHNRKTKQHSTTHVYVAMIPNRHLIKELSTQIL